MEGVAHSWSSRVVTITLALVCLLMIVWTGCSFVTEEEVNYLIETAIEEHVENNPELRGPEGAEGPRGPMGIKGPRGNSGITGLRGPEGPQGEQGIRGPRGEKGEKGDTGERGERGIGGMDGGTGPQGEKGERGLQGPPGYIMPISDDPYEYLASKGSYVVEFTTSEGGGWHSCTDAGESKFGTHHRSHHVELPSEIDWYRGIQALGYYPGWHEARLCADWLGFGRGIDGFDLSRGGLTVKWNGLQFDIVGKLKEYPDFKMLYHIFADGAFYLIDPEGRKYAVFEMESAGEILNNVVTFWPESWRVLRQNFSTGHGNDTADLLNLDYELRPETLAYKRLIIAFSSDRNYTPFQ